MRSPYMRWPLRCTCCHATWLVPHSTSLQSTTSAGQCSLVGTYTYRDSFGSFRLAFLPRHYRYSWLQISTLDNDTEPKCAVRVTFSTHMLPYQPQASVHTYHMCTLHIGVALGHHTLPLPVRVSSLCKPYNTSSY